MIELELLVEVFSPFIEAEKALATYKFIGSDLVVDTYYYDPLRDNLKPNKDGKTFASFRIRQKNKEIKITYKDDVYKDGVWQFSNENELPIENAVEFANILNKLGLKQLVTIRNERQYYEYKDYEIVLENVKNLGVFLEVEYKKNIKENDIDCKRKEIQFFIDSLNLSVSNELNSGKPELYMIRNHINV